MLRKLSKKKIDFFWINLLSYSNKEELENLIFLMEGQLFINFNYDVPTIKDHCNLPEDLERRLNELSWSPRFDSLINVNWNNINDLSFWTPLFDLGFDEDGMDYLLTRGWFKNDRELQSRLVILGNLKLVHNVTGILYGDFELETNYILDYYLQRRKEYLWTVLRLFVKKIRPIAIYWLKVTQENLCQVNGQGRSNDINNFIRDMNLVSIQ